MQTVSLILGTLLPLRLLFGVRGVPVGGGVVVVEVLGTRVGVARSGPAAGVTVDWIVPDFATSAFGVAT